MKAVIGLGNPGREYELTRHNAGFLVLDNFLLKHGGTWRSTRFKGVAARTQVDHEPLLLGKPETYMNLSGHFVSPLLNYYNIPPADLLVVHDELDLPMGRIRVSRAGSAAGHRGVTHIIEQLGTNRFARLRIGVGKPRQKKGVVGHVLSRFSTNEDEIFREVLEHCVEAVACWATHGVNETMNRFNAVNVQPESNQPEEEGG